jgi:hypothetical protein
MTDTPAPAADSREALRRQWHEHADALFDRLCPAAPPQPSPSFAQLEQKAEQLSRDLAVWLLERRAATAPQARPADPPPCPRCAQPARRVTPPGAPLPRRVLTTGLGEVELAREKWRCTTCRVVFFPPGRDPGPHPGGLQP